MRLNMILIGALTFAPIATIATFTGCEENKSAHRSTQGGASSTGDGHGHDHGPGGEHIDEKPIAHGHGGTVIDLGEATFGSFLTKATRDEGPIVAGKDAPIDVTVTPVPGSSVKVIAVRFWIGTEDARGSVKARAEIEDANDPNRLHTHAEIPNPLPDGSQLWIEIEDDQGGTTVGSLDLKM